MTIFGPRATPRYVLRAGEPEEQASGFADEQGWDLISREQADPDRGREFELMWATDRPVTFHYQEDNVAHEGYAYLAGDDRELVAGYESQLVAALDHWSFDDLLREVSEQPDGPDRGAAVLRAGIGAPMDFDQRFFDVIHAAMTDENPQMRGIGVLACSYSPQPQFRPSLEAIAESEPDPEIRDLAKSTLRAYDEFEIGGA
ncbi:hypothetical protein [Flindersiella endophytica]